MSGSVVRIASKYSVGEPIERHAASLKALVWEDTKARVWLAYNGYILSRHALWFVRPARSAKWVRRSTRAPCLITGS